MHQETWRSTGEREREKKGEKKKGGERVSEKGNNVLFSSWKFTMKVIHTFFKALVELVSSPKCEYDPIHLNGLKVF